MAETSNDSGTSKRQLDIPKTLYREVKLINIDRDSENTHDTMIYLIALGVQAHKGGAVLKPVN